MALQFTAVENYRKFTSKRIKTKSQNVLAANPRFREDRMSKLVTHRGPFCPPSQIGLKLIITNLRCYLTTYGDKTDHVGFFYLGFLSRTFANRRTEREGGGHFFNSSLPLPPASQTLRYQLGDYYRELTCAHNQEPESNREPFASKRKSKTTKLRALVTSTGDKKQIKTTQ